MGQKAPSGMRTCADAPISRNTSVKGKDAPPCARQHLRRKRDFFFDIFRRSPDRRRAPNRFSARWSRRALTCAGSCGNLGAATCSSPNLNKLRREGYLRRLGIRNCKEAGLPQTRSSGKLELNSEFLDCLKSDVCVEMQRPISFSSSDDDTAGSGDTQVTVNSGMGATETLCASDLVMGGKSLEDHARRKFLQKLSYEGVWLPKPQRPPSHQTLIIFDWDDTLLCTTFLHRFEGLPVSPAIIRQLQACEEASAKLLKMALSMGQTFIITNAAAGWVESSAECWAPSLQPLIQKIHVVSARSRYEADYPHLPMKWKAEAFLEVRRMLDSQVITNLVSLGDSEYEMEATQAMGREFENATIKLVKFTENPSPEELLKQLELVIEEFEPIVGKAQNVRVKLQRPQTPKC